jgi:inner membrane protein
MDNITHSLVGVALADLAMGRRATKVQRPLFVGAGIIAANLPDLDLAYSRITPPPLGYLLHHRGHTHTVAGLGVLALVLVAAYWFFPSVRKMRVSGHVRFWLLVAIALASHLALDGLNSYGVHPFSPVDNSWYFGDSVFILEPSLWVILGVAAALNAHGRTARLLIALPILILLPTTVSAGAIQIEAVVALAIGGSLFAWCAFRWPPHRRAVAALAALVLIVAGLSGTSRVARSVAVASLTPEVRGRMVDVILTPNPSSPLCWAVIAIELREDEGVYVLWRGTLSLKPEWKIPADCASHQLGGGTRDAAGLGGGRLVLRDVRRQPLQRLRALAKGDCWVRAWLRFGRAPVIEGGAIFDLRFSDRIGQEFSHMRMGRREGCPANIPNWAMPRADLLQ